MTIREAEEFIASVPGSALKVGDTVKTLDPHEYVLRGWREVDSNTFDVFVRLIKAEGYRARAPYRTDRVMTNHYLEIGGWCYWFIYPRMLSRERAEHRKHEPIPSDNFPSGRVCFADALPHSGRRSAPRHSETSLHRTRRSAASSRSGAVTNPSAYSRSAREAVVTPGDYRRDAAVGDWCR
jgi:hypothetical protein